MSVQEITRAALDLAEEEREVLGYTLLRSLSLEGDWNDTDLSNEQLERRLREMKDDPSKSLALEEVFPELESMIRRR